MPNRLLSVVIASVLSAYAVGAQNPTPPGAKPVSAAYRNRLLGVYDAQSGEPLEGVEVSDAFNGNKSLTTKTGTVSLFFLPDGGGVVRLKKIGYEVQTLTVAISPADTTPITVMLTRAQALAPVVVKDSAVNKPSARMAGFEARRASGFGHFMTDTIFRAHENQVLASLIPGHMPGLQVVVGPGGKKFLASGRKQCAGFAFLGRSANGKNDCDPTKQPSCYVSVYVDGVRIYDAAQDNGMLPDFERMSAIDYAAAEFYQGASIPPEFNSSANSDCGVLLLWTREK